MKRSIRIIALLVFASISVLAQETIDPKTVSEKYDEISRLELDRSEELFALSVLFLC